MIDGRRIHDIASFYDEINRVLMSGEDWRLAESLDALDDLFYGGYGAIKGAEPVRLEWTHFSRMEAALGLDATLAQLRRKLDQPKTYDVALARRRIEALQAGEGQTYLRTIRDILASHPNITLVTA